MRVVDITSFFSDACGGIKTYYREKARFLPPLGVDCHFVVPGRVATEEAFGQAVLHRLPGRPLPGNAHYRLFRGRQDVVALLERLRPDVVEIGSYFLLPRGVMRAIADLRPRPAVVGFFHSDVARTLLAPLVRWLPRCLETRVMEAAWEFVRRRHALYRATLVASRELATSLDAFGIPRVRWVGLGVDHETFRPRARAVTGREAPEVVYAGRLSGDKGFMTLLEAWDAIHAASGATLRVAGDGPQIRELTQMAASRPSIRYVGCLQQPEAVARLLGEADLAVTPGPHETFSLSTAEALACGTPVVAPAAGGAGELVARSGGGALFRSQDASDLAARAIEVLSLAPAERRSLGVKGREHVVAHFSWPAVARRLNAVYEAALA
jgi:alpha-1,6-mannosyltransferase